MNHGATALDATTGALGAAFEMAFAAHAGQTDKSGAPYIAHVVRVAAALDRTEDQIVGLLHDVVEDCDVTVDQVAEVFGETVAQAVDAISKRKGERLQDYLDRVAANPTALRVKNADLADNSSPVRMALLDPATRDRLVQKYEKARRHLEMAHG